MIYFGSDNWAGAHPRIAAALSEHASGYAPAYGSSDLDRAVEQKFSAIFEREVAVFFVATGTAANSLAMASLARPGGVVFCHREAHMIEDEGGAPEYLSGGLRLCPVDGRLGRIDPESLTRSIARYPAQFVHSGQPAAISITQASEVGTVYSLDEIASIAAIARQSGLPLHMDGARFANALAALDATPAEMTWKAGVDIVSFGGTKNGCWCAEAVLIFDLERAREFAFIRKRAAQLFSKARFISAQFDAYFEDGHWLATARHANAMAARLADAIRPSNSVRLAWEPQANELFAVMSPDKAEELKARGAVFYPWHVPAGHDGEVGPGEQLCRFVTSFATTEDDIDRFGDLLA